MQYPQIQGWWRRWWRRTSTWGALLDDQQILLASLRVQASGSVRVAVFEHQHTPVGLVHPQERDAWLVQQLRAVSAPLPRSARTMVLALHESRCRQGVYQPSGQLSPSQLAAEVQLEAASALGVTPQAVGFDFETRSTPGSDVSMVPWAACLREDLQHWQDQARRAGWRLPVVEPEHQAAKRAAECLRGEAQLHWVQSPQDWQFERRPVRVLDPAEWQQLRASAQWGALVACGAALGALQ